MEILYKDNNIAVCVKPVGLDSEQQMPEALKAQLGGEIYPLHRLDKNVGGIMVYARTKSAAASLSRAIADGQFVKEYYAMVHGTPEMGGTLEDLLFKDSRKNKVFVVKKMRAGVKKARLSYEVVRPGQESLLHITLDTGRSHQIRVQFSSRGFPLVGDHKYGSRSKTQDPMLYACRITFPYQKGIISYFSKPEWADLSSGGE